MESVTIRTLYNTVLFAKDAAVCIEQWSTTIVSHQTTVTKQFSGGSWLLVQLNTFQWCKNVINSTRKSLPLDYQCACIGLEKQSKI